MRRPLLILLTATLLVTTAVWLWSRFTDGPIPDDELPPMGVWFGGNPATRALTHDPDELARLLALPYAAGEKLATAPGLGVVVHDPERSQPGVNFYVSGHGSEAILIDNDGTFLHRWQADQFQLFPDLKPSTEAQPFNLRRAHLLPNGDILALWHGGGMARLDLRSNVIWTQDLGFYNDLFVGGGPPTPGGGRAPAPPTLGTLVALHKTAEVRPRFGNDPVLNDQLVWLDPATGRVLRRLSLLDAVLDSEWAGLLDSEPRDPADLLHANTITVLDESTIAGSPFQPGWILTSLREISLVAVLDPEAKGGRGKIVWAQHGPFNRQHEPILVPGSDNSPATLVVFDNSGGPERSTRVLRLDLDGNILWRYPDPDGPTAGQSLDSTFGAGSIHLQPNGNLLIIDSVSGRAIELAPDDDAGWQDIVWQFETPHRAGKRGTLIATLMDLKRLPRPDWLPEPGP